ncbi:hypothetical protein H5410_040485 [Solanum commersonii]|uniref:CCHC-type domain-containing protein n=1 Tax=Solanum commersonii TaxID=4109 RepID=A0A9J5XNZ8_SOLCO|nr:hypothetical protein H5410_040485 [Solanum commersonii]
MVRIHITSELDLHSLRVVWHNEYRDGSTSCFKCGQEGHFMKECPKNWQGNGNQGKSSSVAPPDMAASRGATSGTGRRSNNLYAITSRQEQENSLDVVTGIIKVFTLDVYALLDKGASLYFVTPYVANNIDVLHEKLCEPFCVSSLLALVFILSRSVVICSISGTNLSPFGYGFEIGFCVEISPLVFLAFQIS